MSAQKHAISILLATPPAHRSEIVRQAYLYSRLGLQHSFTTRLGEGVYQGPRSEFESWRRLHTSRKRTSRGSLPAEHTPLVQPTGPAIVLDSKARATPRRAARFFFTSLAATVCLLAGFAMAAAPAAETINGFVNPPTDAETLTLYEPLTSSAIEVNDHITTHPLAVKLRAQQGMTESRPHLKIPPAMRPHNLTGGTLLGEGKIEVPPLTFQGGDAELPELVQISYVGPALCGHPGIIHGGLLATMLDEGLARACFPALPNKVGVTASLKIDYRVPCPAQSYVVLKAKTTKVEGRKAWVKGWIELLGDDDGEGTKLVQAEALFIEPKWGAKTMAPVYSSQ